MQRGFTLWFTGLPCSGKSTISNIVEKELKGRGLRVEVLDGDLVRTNLTKGLGFSREDRDENIRRVAFVCKLLTRNGVAAIAAVISPYRKARAEARAEIGSFVEVYVKCPLEVCIERDVKGMYARALRGELQAFTGISDPYEEPENPDIVVETDKETPEESALKVIRKLEEMRLISGPEGWEGVYSQEEEVAIRSRLRQLGYI